MTALYRLHYAPDNASLCVRLALEALGLRFDTVLVDRTKKAQKSPAYLALNPNGLIPTLETPNGMMFETGAILLALADTAPGTIFPAPGHAPRNTALTWLFWLSNTLHPALRMYFYPAIFGSNANDIQAHARKNIATHLTVIAPHWPALASHTLLACYLMPMLRWSALYGDRSAPIDLTQWPDLYTAAQAFEALPFAQKSAQSEGLGPTPFSAPGLPNPPEGSAL